MQRPHAPAHRGAKACFPFAPVRDTVLYCVQACLTRARVRPWSFCVTISLKRADVFVSLSGGDHPKGFGVTLAYLSACASWRRC